MEKFHKYLDIGFLLALLIIPFLSSFGRIDIIGPQYLYLSLLLVIYLTTKFFGLKNFELKLNYSTFFYLLFLIMASLSIFNSLNIVESIIDLSKYILTFLILVISFTIFNNNRNYIKIAIKVLIGFLFIETLYILKIFIENYSFDSPPTRLREFQGFAYNQNIASNSILVKIPLLLFLFMRAINTKTKLLLGFILSVSVFDILIIGSRSSIYGIYLLLLLLSTLFVFIKYFKSLQISRKKILIIVVIIISVFITQNFLYTNSTANLKAIERSTQLNDYSTNYRLRLWDFSIEMIKEHPFLGIGIGNWKILSIKYAKENIQQYEVPKHAHNDFLNIMSETGVLGGLFFLLFFITPFYFILKNYPNLSPKEKLLSIFLIFSLISVGIDSFFNFPRIRPYSLLNLFWLIALVYVLKNGNNNISNKTGANLSFTASLIFSLFAVYIFNRFNNSLKEQTPLYIEYNQFPDKIITPVKDILLFEDEFPNISNVLIPLKIAKARYLFLEGEYDKAKRLIEEGRKHNPYLGFGDLLMQRIHLAQNKLDSAVFYGKRSIEKLPKNESHYTFYQMTQEKVRDLDEIERVFLQGYSLESEAIWQNYLISIAIIKLERGIDFTRDEEEYLNQALELYPNNKIIQIADKIINYGGGLILIANDYDSKAIKNYNEKKYQKAIDYWIKATEIIPNDEAYYLNIAHSYISIDEIEKAEKYFDLIETKKLKGISGKFEFLKSINNLKLDRTIIACNYAKVSRDLGYPDAQKILDQYQCYN